MKLLGDAGFFSTSSTLKGISCLALSSGRSRSINARFASACSVMPCAFCKISLIRSPDFIS